MIQRRKERAKRRYPPQAERINASGVRGRRVLENASEKKERLNPVRSQSWNWRKLIDERRNAEERSGWRIIIAAGSNEGYRT